MKRTTCVLGMIAILGIIVLSWLWSANTGRQYEHSYEVFNFCVRWGLIASLIPSFFLARSFIQKGLPLLQKAALIPLCLLIIAIGPFALHLVALSLKMVSLVNDSPPMLF
jgi:hypothetical protein